MQPQTSAVQFPSYQRKSYMPEKSSRDKRRAQKAYMVTRSFQVFNEKFYMDQLGEPLQRNERTDCAIPDYDRAYYDTLDGEIEVPETDPHAFSKVSRMCFNCGMKDHQVKDCPSPRDQRGINQRRQQFLDKVSNSPQAGSTRYHADKEIDESDPRFASFKPGVISEALQEALGMERHNLPPYIYQMRMLGYPPGHLHNARSTVSGLNMYNGTANKKDLSGDSDTDGGDGLVDVEKIIDFPGFNTKPPSHIYDSHKERNALPMDERHDKDIMISYHRHRNDILRRKMEKENKEIRSAKRRKMNDPEEELVVRVEDNINEVDMDIGGDSPQRNEDGLKQALFQDDAENTIEIIESADGEVEEGEIDENPPENIEGGEVANESDEDFIEVVETGDLSEEQLKIRREIILKKLEEQMKLKQEDEVVIVSSETDQSVILVESDSDSDQMMSMDKDAASQEPGIRENMFQGINDEDQRDSDSVKVEEILVEEETYEESGIATNNDDNGAMENMPDVITEVHTEIVKSPESIVDCTQDENPETFCENSNQEDSYQYEPSPKTIQSPIHCKNLPNNGENASTSLTEENSGSPLNDESLEVSAKGLPHRSKFAKGVTQFDAYYTETKSSGVFNKLRGLLKNSPIRQSKGS
uniref:Zinc finger CCHC domain-containing protein 8 n=1 Tax=Phallusia mammillata TaxID=59560 RepID=A0A6F9DWU8_9ASCI|nr:zinc finger CCHC domain-containing protein 8 [Phallusia mammillata]